jgi:hypothetical protein
MDTTDRTFVGTFDCLLTNDATLSPTETTVSVPGAAQTPCNALK